MIERVQSSIPAAVQRAHPNLWHAIIGYTTGDVVRKLIPDHVPYATKYGLWDTEWSGLLPLLEKRWKPFLEGGGMFKEAISRLVEPLF